MAHPSPIFAGRSLARLSTKRVWESGIGSGDEGSVRVSRSNEQRTRRMGRQRVRGKSGIMTKYYLWDFSAFKTSFGFSEEHRFPWEIGSIGSRLRKLECHSRDKSFIYASTRSASRIRSASKHAMSVLYRLWNRAESVRDIGIAASRRIWVTADPQPCRQCLSYTLNDNIFGDLPTLAVSNHFRACPPKSLRYAQSVSFSQSLSRMLLAKIGYFRAARHGSIS